MKNGSQTLKTLMWCGEDFYSIHLAINVLSNRVQNLAGFDG